MRSNLRVKIDRIFGNMEQQNNVAQQLLLQQILPIPKQLKSPLRIIININFLI